MAKIINNIRLLGISGKRDKALGKIEFNESYLCIALSEFNEKSDLGISKVDVKKRRLLLPLEKKAISEKESMQHMLNEKLSNLKAKQRLPRLAVEQSYKRKLDKLGKKAAEEYRSEAIAKLDRELEQVEKNWTERVNNASAEKNKEAVALYKKEAKRLNKYLEEYKKSSEANVKEKYKNIEEKTKEKNAVLAKRIEGYNRQIKMLSAGIENSMKEKNTVLEINDLVMLFDGLKAVDELSFKVKEGEIFGLIGPNGAGKTTVFNCITQFNKLTSGSIYYRSANGSTIDVTKKRVHDIVKVGIVRTFQNVELIWELSVLENMLIGSHSLYNANLLDHLLHTRKLSREEKIMRAHALDVLERLNLLAYKDMIPYGLPYGILKKIELARTLMVNPRLIILDEPAAGLNEAETEELAETINKIRKDYNCTIFLVEHDMGLVMDICDTVCAISFGKKLAIGTPSQIQENAVVQEAYLGGTM